jgi:hypothetical protein
VWWDYPVDAALINSLPRLRFMQRIACPHGGDATAALARKIPVSAFPLGVDRVVFHAFPDGGGAASCCPASRWSTAPTRRPPEAETAARR